MYLMGGKETYDVGDVRHRGTSSREKLKPSDITVADTLLRQALDQRGTVGGEVALLRLRGEEAVDGLDVGLEELAELSRHGLGRPAHGEGLDGVDLVEDAHEEQREDGVELLLGVQALGVLGRLQGQAERARGEVQGGRLSDVLHDVEEVGAHELVRLVPDQGVRGLRVEGLEVARPLAAVQLVVHAALLAEVEGRVARAGPSEVRPHELRDALAPVHRVLGRIVEHVLGAAAGADGDGLGLGRGALEVEVFDAAEVGEDLFRFAGNY